MQINGVELEFNLYDIDTMEIYDASITAASNVAKIAKTTPGISVYGQIRADMLGIRMCFDHIFGDGTGEKVCGTTDLNAHMDAYKALIKEANRQQREYSASMKNLEEIQMDRKSINGESVEPESVNTDTYVAVSNAEPDIDNLVRNAFGK